MIEAPVLVCFCVADVLSRRGVAAASAVKWGGDVQVWYADQNEGGRWYPATVVEDRRAQQGAGISEDPCAAAGLWERFGLAWDDPAQVCSCCRFWSATIVLNLTNFECGYPIYPTTIATLQYKFL